MKGMPHLMRQGNHGLERAVKLHQHIGMDTVNTVGVSTASLALILININPAALKAVL